MSASTATMVVPCYDEARRLDVDALVRLADGGVALILVDDGSTDGTLSRLPVARRSALRMRSR